MKKIIALLSVIALTVLASCLGAKKETPAETPAVEPVAETPAEAPAIEAPAVDIVEAPAGPSVEPAPLPTAPVSETPAMDKMPSAQ